LIDKSKITGSRAISTVHHSIEITYRMEILDILRSRYTTKTYDSTFHLSDKQLEDIKEMLRLCPSSINSQPWAFELIGDRETKSLLAQHSYSNKDRIEQASHLLVIYNYRDVATFEAERIATQVVDIMQPASVLRTMGNHFGHRNVGIRLGNSTAAATYTVGA